MLSLRLQSASVRLWAVALLAVACGTTAPPAAVNANPISVQMHAVEIPRIPVPATHRDGLIITWLDQRSSWAHAGLQVDDVLGTANGVFLMEPDDLWRVAGGHAPREVRVVSSERGVYGGRVLTIDVTP